MAKKITKLTPDQEAELPRFRQRYLDLACNGSRIDRPALESALADAYAVIGKPAPKLFIFDSPAACMLALKIFRLPPDEILGDQLRGQLWGQLRDQLGGQLGDQLRDQLRDQLGDQLRDQLWDQLWGQLGDQLRDQLRDQLGGQVGGQRIYDPHYLWGSQDLYWIAWARFAQQIGVKLEPETDRRLGVMERISEQCEWWWPCENIVIASQKPVAVRWDDQGRLHAEDSPAVAYADGYGLYAWHGVTLPEHWVTQRETIDPTEILKERDVEKRAAGAACIGWPRMLSALKYKVIDDSGSPDLGQLIEVKLNGLSQPGRFLKAECPRNGIIVEGVPPVSDIDGLPIETALAAQAWRIGDPQSEYAHPPQRT
jgi:hypothetical protein